MTNFQVYKKTLSFSLVKFALDLGLLVLLIGLPVGALFLFKNVVAPIVAFVIALVAVILLNIFVGNRIKAAQIAMMTKGCTEGDLPEHTFHEGFEVVKKRFASLTLFFMITNAIKGTFRQLGRTITRFGSAIGGEIGGSVTSTIDSIIQTLIQYLCDCCLGWVFYRSDVNMAKAACEGAAIFFKHGKTLAKNMGRIFGMGLLSLLVVGGAFFGIFFLIFNSNPAMFNELIKIINEGSSSPIDPEGTVVFTIVFSAFLAIVLWGILHSVFVSPFILTGVLRNFLASGKEDIPSESEFNEIAQKSSRFRKLQERME